MRSLAVPCLVFFFACSVAPTLTIISVVEEHREAAFCKDVVTRWLRVAKVTPSQDDWLWESYGDARPNRYTKAQVCLMHLGTMQDRQSAGERR